MSDYLVRFENGPLHGKIKGGRSDAILSDTMFAWPLPDRLGVLTHPGVENVAFWDADDPAEADLPELITGSPNAIVYRKVSQSVLPEDAEGVLRGAQYRLEGT